jgi:hypothetical protein
MGLGIGAAIVAAGAVVAGIIFVTVLTYKKIKEWFQRIKPLTNQDNAYYETTIKMEIANGNCGMVAGVFNRKTGDFVAAQGYEAGNLDTELAAKHKNKTVVLYN